MTTRRTGATTSPSGPTTRRSPTRCPRWPSGSGRWESPRSISSKRTVRRSAWPSLGLEHQALHERGQVRPRFAVRACDRLERGRVLHVRGHALRDALLERQHVLVLVEHAASAGQIGLPASLMFGWARDFVWTPSLRVGEAWPFVSP